MNFSSTGTLPILFDAAIRSACLVVAVWVVLRLLRSRRPQAASLAWFFVLCAAVAMPLLVTATQALLESAPEAVAWMPAAPTTVFLRPLVPVEPEVFLLPDVLRVLLIIYGIVAGIEFIRVCAGLIRGLILRSRAVPLKQPWTEGSDVRITDALTVPVTFGRIILLPKDALEWEAPRRRMVLTHEQAHCRRLDFYVQVLAQIHRAVFWFSPFAWLLKAELTRAAEDSCDDEALRNVPDRVSYAEILVEMAGRGSTEGFVGVSMARIRTVTQRVERILKEEHVAPEISWTRRIVVVAGILPLVVLSAGMYAQVEQPALEPVTRIAEIQTEVLSRVVRQTAAPAPQRTTRAESTQISEGWIDREVPDISTKEEQTAFKALQTDAEREEFIRQFWLRRDPTPGTAANEFQTEYYSRVAIAQQRYGSGGNPGHLTDRGRILVKFGTPSEIRILAQGTNFLPQNGGRTQTFPVELWRYPFIEGIGNNIQLEFADINGIGDYRLTTDPNLRLLSTPQ